jgi:ketosteroid isomerase-like protein
MSEENAEVTPIDVIRQSFDAWNSADLDTLAGLFDADAEVIPDPSWMEAGPFNGRAAIREWYAGLRGAWDERNKVVITELFEVGGRVIARIDWQVRGRSSGIEMDFDATSVNTVERRKIVRQRWYFDHDKALQAAGLSE